MNKFLKLLGLFFVLSYMINIYYIWFDANLSGYTYFSAGEPNLYIKYTEWIGGILGIFHLYR